MAEERSVADDNPFATDAELEAEARNIVRRLRTSK